MKKTGPIPDGYVAIDGELAIGGMTASALVDRAGDTPLFVYSADHARRRVADLRAAMPQRLAIHYAMKGNPFPPVLELMNGLVDGFDIASGGELELALAADLIVASENAEFALTEVKLGMVADSGGVLRLPQRLPRAIALELLLTGRRMGAHEAARWGLVNQVVAPDGLMAAANALAQQIVQAAPLAVGAVMEIAKATAGMPIEQAYQALRGGGLPVYQAMLRSEDAAEGPRAFGEKRAPRWAGR